jgi:hypothetical protein
LLKFVVRVECNNYQFFEGVGVRLGFELRGVSLLKSGDLPIETYLQSINFALVILGMGSLELLA